MLHHVVRRKWCLFAPWAAAGALLWSPAARAHPHVWVTIQAQLVFAPDHTVSEIRYVWLFDPAYSAYAVLGLDKNHDGNITKQALTDTSIINTAAFEGARYFTFLSSQGSEIGISGASNFALAFDGGRLSLEFRLHFTRSVDPYQGLDIRIYDPSFFVSLTLSGASDAVTAVGMPGGCAIEVSRPESMVDAQRAIPDEIFLAMNGNATYGEKYAVETKVSCMGSHSLPPEAPAQGPP